MRSLKQHGFADVELNKYARAFCLAAFGALGAFQVAAFTGGVTTYDYPDADRVRRTTVNVAKAGPEFDATYQRTMRTAQTKAAAARALVGVVKGIAGISTILTLGTLAVELNGIWKKDSAGNNVLEVKVERCMSNTPCYLYTAQNEPSSPKTLHPTLVSACTAGAGFMSTGGQTFTYSYAIVEDLLCVHIKSSDGQRYTSSFGRVEVPPPPPDLFVLTDQQLAERMAISRPTTMPRILDDLDDRGLVIPWPEPEVEDMPVPIVLSPRVTTNPDGSKVTQQTTLLPYRGPDGKTVNWERQTATTTTSAPAPDGSTVTGPPMTVVENAGPSAPPPEPDVAECVKSPNTLGCIEMDMPSGEIPRVNKDVSYAAESMFGAGACPADKTIPQSLTGRPIVLSYAQTCSALSSYVQPIIIAIALMMAYMIILPGNRE